jgi:hypothetical protein
MDFDDFLIKSFAKGNESLDDFLDRQVVVRDIFKKRGEEVSWILDLSHLLFMIKNFKTGAHFKIKKEALLRATDFSKNYEELEFETKQFTDFLK